MILFLDTESNPVSKEISSIQISYGGHTYLFTEFNQVTFKVIKKFWNEAEAIVIYNAPYDLGALSATFDNEYKWVEEKADDETSSYWKFRIFDNDYKVRRISSHRNLIKGMNRYWGKENTKIVGKKNPTPKYNKKISYSSSTPVIDLLKLWSILIDDGEYNSIGLKAVVEREFAYKMLSWSPENALNEQYMSDDVEYLEKLWIRFLEKIAGIPELKSFSLEDFAGIKTPATFTKIMYDNEYIDLKEIQERNDNVIEHFGLGQALEESYHGGITLSFYRGHIKNVVWIDIEGAYLKAIETLKTDNFIEFDFEKVQSFNMREPYLLRIKSNFIMKTINKSLKLYYVEEPELSWTWNFDIDGIRHLIDDYEYEVLEIYKPIPLTVPNTYLTDAWQNMKNSLNKKDPHERVLREFYKFLGNTSYGIKAQRKPFRTVHTNMVIAGMITAKVHQILGKIIYVGRKSGNKNLYNDTDSAAFNFDTFNPELIDDVNSKISPFKVASEGVFSDNLFLSLKRYVSQNDISEQYNLSPEKDKIKIHGKGRYQVSRSEIMDFIKSQKVTDDDECLIYGSMAANTMRTMNMIMNLDGMKELITHPHPFMFVTNVTTDKTRKEFFEAWYDHIDTKLTFNKSKENHFRTFRRFTDSIKAKIFYSGKSEKTESIDMSYRFWDKEILEDFNKV